MSRYLKIAALAALLGAALCFWRFADRREAPHGAFYYWQTIWSFAPDEAAAWREAGIDRLYVRFFDVVYDEERRSAQAVAPIEFATPPPSLPVTPVVYVTNEALARTDAAAIPELARHIGDKVAGMAAAAPLTYDELQIDCDWTEATRARFFALLSALKTEGRRLTATIRLHQVKYPHRTGVPPIDRGMLMFYNMGRIGAAGDAMSIFNADDAGKYVAAIPSYPLPLDVALPLFSWAVLQRSGKAAGLIEGIAAAEFAGSPLFREVGRETFRTLDGTLFRGRYFQKDDIVRFETVTPEITRSAAALVARHQPKLAPFATVSFFDLNTRTLARYENGFFKKTLAVFR